MSRTPETVNRIQPQVSIGTFALLCTCFVLSGIAALVYQTAWTRQFAIVFGTSELAVATVLAAYMGGLALGALLAERFLPRVTRPVLTYALLEIGIAGSAVIVVPLLLVAANLALQAMFGGQASPPDSDHAGTTLFYLLSAFVALALPTTLMGATLPMLARYAVAEEAQIGRRIGILYAMNTAGAVAGALLTAFVLLPELGLQHTIWIGAVLNGIVFLLAVALARRVPVEKPASVTNWMRRPPPPPPPPLRPHSLRQFSGTGVGTAADAAGRSRGVFPGSSLGPDAGARGGQQHLCLWRHGRELSHRHCASVARSVPRIARNRERAALALGLALIFAAVGGGGRLSEPRVAAAENRGTAGRHHGGYSDSCASPTRCSPGCCCCR